VGEAHSTSAAGMIQYQGILMLTALQVQHLKPKMSTHGSGDDAKQMPPSSISIFLGAAAGQQKVKTKNSTAKAPKFETLWKEPISLSLPSLDTPVRFTVQQKMLLMGSKSLANATLNLSELGLETGEMHTLTIPMAEAACEQGYPPDHSPVLILNAQFINLS